MIQNQTSRPPEKQFFPKSLNELFIVWLLAMMGFQLLGLLNQVGFLKDYTPYLQALFLMYFPIFLFYRQKRSLKIFETNLKELKKSLLTFLILSLAIFPLLQLLNHFFQAIAFNHHYIGGRHKDLFNFFLFHLLVVALPEEVFFRAYFQEEFHRLWKGRPWRILGASLGPAWIATCVIFAFSHSLMAYQWWHFAIFFPALAFGWLREKTGYITASILFHALSNTYAHWVFLNYK